MADDKFDAAMRLGSEVRLKMHSLVDQIRPYAEADNPFAAIVDAHQRAEEYERDQERRIFLGPPK